MIPQPILDQLIPPDRPAPSHDPNDVLLGDAALFHAEDFKHATHAILGCPQDMGVTRNHGRPGAANAPKAIRSFLYGFKPPAKSEVRLIDLGDIVSCDNLEACHERLHAAVLFLLEQGKTVLVMGGGNDISLPDASAVHTACPDYVAVNMDAHLDMRRAKATHSGTPYRELIDQGRLDPMHFHEVGIQPWANSPIYLEEAATLGVSVHPLHQVRDQGTDRFLSTLFHSFDNRPLFAGLDMDCVRASDAPGKQALQARPDFSPKKFWTLPTTAASMGAPRSSRLPKSTRPPTLTAAPPGSRH
nr:arginase family protein [Pseudodesulfovibrio tunisiensis]